MFIKYYQEYFEQYLLLLLVHDKDIFSMPWRIVILHLKFKTTSKVLGNCTFSVLKYLWVAFIWSFFYIVTSSQSLFLTLQLFSFIRPLSSPSLSFPHCFCRISWTVILSAILVRYLFLVTPFTLNLSFTSSIIIFHFFAVVSPLLANSLLWLFILWNVLWVYLWEKGGSTATLFLWTSAQWPVIDRLWKSDVIDHL